MADRSGNPQAGPTRRLDSQTKEEKKMAIGMLATITVQEGKNEEFEKVFLELIDQVRANEPGNVFYALNRSTSDPQVYRVMEQYESGEALDAHAKSEHFQAANRQLAGLVAGAPDIELLEVVTQ